jgi:hypothetical protein
MKKKGVGIVRLYQLPRRSHWVSQLDSVFRALEPDVSKINEKAKAPVLLGSLVGGNPARSGSVSTRYISYILSHSRA